jgi:hypothetical protein
LSSGGFVLGVTSSPSDQFSGISIIEMESFVYFKIHEDLEEVAIKKVFQIGFSVSTKFYRFFIHA